MTATDLIVTTRNPELLDRTVQRLPLTAAVVVDGSYDPGAGTCRVRVFGDPGFLRFAITQQGYGTIVGEETVEQPAVPFPAYNMTDEQACDVAVASGWIEDTPAARAAYLAGEE